MTNKTNFKQIFTIIFSFVLGGVIMLAILKWTPVLEQTLGSGSVQTYKNKTEVYEKSSLAASVNKIYDAVMVVNAYQNEELASTGTAFVYKADNKYAYLLTNQHVVSKYNDVKVINTKDEEVEAKVLGGDQFLDLAVLRIDKKYASLIAELGESETMKLGDTVFTVGTPLGNDYRGSVTSGVLSGKDRTVSVSTSAYNGNDWVMKVLQIDASLNPGNSGGPLLNVNGQVVGVCSMKLVDDEIEGMGFAIPIEIAKTHIDELEKGNKIKWPVLGVKMQDVSSSSEYYYSNKQTKGVVVADVIQGTAADKAGIKAGDIIIKLDDQATDDVAHLRYELYKHSVGDEITITYIRNEKEHTTKATLKGE